MGKSLVLMAWLVAKFAKKYYIIVHSEHFSMVTMEVWPVTGFRPVTLKDCLNYDSFLCFNHPEVTQTTTHSH